MKIAVVGAGISGLGAAYALHRRHDVTLYEAANRAGGHTHTVDVTLDDTTFPVDTGFLVYNERTYPQLIQLFADLAIPTAKSDMSFGLSVRRSNDCALEWAGTSLDTVFAQRRNLYSPRFIAMLCDLLRFNKHATRIALADDSHDDISLGQFLERHRYGQPFRHWYLLPMAAAIWSCPIATMLDYPIATFARFCHNHGLLQVSGRPQWFTVKGGARQYVTKICAALSNVRVGDAVSAVTRDSSHVTVESRTGTERFDHVVLACHSDQSLSILKDADNKERSVIGEIRYQPNRAWLHTDVNLMPESRKVWSSWNYLSESEDNAAGPAVSVTYLLNKLQPLPFNTPLLLSLNPRTEPRAAMTIAQIEYSHPIFDRRAIAAQRLLPGVQGRRRVWFAGAWTGYGFHEDGLKSGLAVADALAR
ncbi:MAG: FAD-dependent oxidoreductase [Pseudomonadota bacterium]|nr:FAD-dependent oxidoreductase [Pseudomonadota bacterium]